MAPTVVSIPTEQISQEIANFTIGFAKLIVRDNIEDAIGAGSGTLAVLGPVHGVLTAAHVLDSLPNTGPVGLVRYLNENGRYQKQTIDMAGATKLVIRAEEFGMNGPDLGFLRLPADSVGWLKAINSFYELRRYRDEYIAGKLPDGSPLMALVGMIDERTKDLPPERRGQRRKGFEALFTDGDIVSGRIRDRHELMDFVPKNYPDFKLPGSFEGTSGGAIWQLFLQMVDGQAKVVAKRYWGIPFYQRRRTGKTAVLICHGPDGIYKAMFDKIVDTWPSEVV